MSKNKFPGWHADTTLFGDEHIEFYVIGPDGEQWGILDDYAILTQKLRPYVVPKRKIRKIDKIVCKKIADCHAAWQKKRPLAEHVKVEC